jgi:hypothetical protein
VGTAFLRSGAAGLRPNHCAGLAGRAHRAARAQWRVPCYNGLPVSRPLWRIVARSFSRCAPSRCRMDRVDGRKLSSTLRVPTSSRCRMDRAGGRKLGSTLRVPTSSRCRMDRADGRKRVHPVEAAIGCACSDIACNAYGAQPRSAMPALLVAVLDVTQCLGFFWKACLSSKQPLTAHSPIHP